MSNERSQAPQKDNHEPANAIKTAAQEKTSSPASSYLPAPGLIMSGASSGDDIPLTRDNILYLQRTIGNRAVVQLLQRKAKISQPGDAYEREADRVAEQVVEMPAPSLSRKTRSATRENTVEIGRVGTSQGDEIHRQASVEDEKRKREEEKKVVQAKPIDGSGYVQRQTMSQEDEKRKRGEEEVIQAKEAAGQTPASEPEIESQINHVQGGGGEPLAESVRAYYEPRFGQDFSDVRVHNGAQAAEAAQAINARAYTTGNDIVFGAGEYAPGTTEGKHLLAHELTHVVQQSPSSLVQRDPDDEAEDTSYRTPEFYDLDGLITAKNNMQSRLDSLFSYQEVALRIGDTVRSRISAYSTKYETAYNNYAQAVRSARQEAQNQNMWLGVVVGVAMNVTAAFILPSTAAGWFALTAAELATALASGAGQALTGAALSSALQFSGGDLEPGGLSPGEQELEVWRQVAALYRAAARQSPTIRDLSRIVSGAQFLIGEIRVQIAGGVQTMTEEQALDDVGVLVRANQSMARTDDAALERSLTELRDFETQINALDPESYSERRMEQDIWILWISGLDDASVLDLDAIEDRLHAVGVLGSGSRLGIDFGSYTFWWEEDEARDAARGEASQIRQQRREMRPRSPVE